MWRIAHWTNISMGIEILCILNVLDTTQVYTSYRDLASFSRRVSAREPCGQFWDENEKLCLALASILLGSRCPEKHSIESKPIGVDFNQLVIFFKKRPNPLFCSGTSCKKNRFTSEIEKGRNLEKVMAPESKKRETDIFVLWVTNPLWVLRKPLSLLRGQPYGTVL